MTAEALSRILFALTVFFHFLFPPMTIGLGVVLIVLQGLPLWTRKQLYLDMARFWTRVFGLIFAIGVVTGIPMQFQFGTNWARYARFVGDVFGSPLAIEGIYAFFLEVGLLALLLLDCERNAAQSMPYWPARAVLAGAYRLQERRPGEGRFASAPGGAACKIRLPTDTP
jgi:cytochrome d ubiquinol oxidase subunit I